MDEQRYSLSDDLKRFISGENETVFRLLESRFCVEIQTRLPGLRIVAKENYRPKAIAITGLLEPTPEKHQDESSGKKP